MRYTQRSITLGMFITLTGIALFLALNGVLRGYFGIEIIISALTAVVTSILALAYRAGWEPARYVLLLFVTLVVAWAVSQTRTSNQVMLLPSAMALVLARPWLIIGTGLFTYAAALISSPASDYSEISIFTLYAMIVMAIYLGRMIAEVANREAASSAQHAEAERVRAKEQAAHLAEANRQQDAQLEQQARLLNLVSALETPTVRLANGVLFAPLVGHLDSRRAQQLTSRLLEAVHTQRARLIVLDIAGVATVDTLVARALLDTTRALNLLGCEVTLSGISAEVALTLTHQGMNLGNLSTVRSPQEALERHMANQLAH